MGATEDKLLRRQHSYLGSQFCGLGGWHSIFDYVSALIGLVPTLSEDHCAQTTFSEAAGKAFPPC